MRQRVVVGLAWAASVAQGFVVTCPPLQKNKRPSVEAPSALGLRSLRNFFGGRREAPEPTPEETQAPAFEEEDECGDSSRLDFFADVDALHASKRYADAYERLKAEAESPDVQWRLARVCVDLSALNKADKERYVREGLAAAEKAVAAVPENPFAQKWYGIALGLVGDFENVRVKIRNSAKIKTALDLAHAELPDDPTVSLALGQWCAKLSGLGLIERRIASAIFGAIPAASHEDALFYFEKSHALKNTPRTARLIKQTKQKLGRTVE